MRSSKKPFMKRAYLGLFGTARPHISPAEKRQSFPFAKTGWQFAGESQEAYQRYEGKAKAIGKCWMISRGAYFLSPMNRYLVKRIASKILLIRDHSLKCYEGGYGYYMDKITEEHRSKQIGAYYNGIADNIRRLENELAFLGGKLDTTREEEQKELLTRKFLETAKELNSWKEKLAARP